MAHAGLVFVRLAEPPRRPDEAVLFLGSDVGGDHIEVVGVELADGSLRVIQCDEDARFVSGVIRGGGKVAGLKDRAPKTKTGVVLDPAYEQKLAEEAEAGFDPETLIRRRAGRPSLSGGAGHSNRVDLRVDTDTYDAIRRLAEESNRKVSDVVRDAIQRYLQAS